MASDFAAVIELLSAIAAIAVVYSTVKPCKASGISYLLGVPAGFGLLAVAFVSKGLMSFVGSSAQGGELLLGAIFLLIQSYGLLFLALTYARRTRLRFVGESTSIELGIPGAVTIAVLAYILTYQRFASPTEITFTMELSLRTVMAFAALYLVYETGRNWSLTQKTSEGFVTIGFALLFIEQLGFMLAAQKWGDVAVFLGYEGRVIGLFVIIAITHIKIGKGDLTTVLRRLGLIALAH